MIVTIEALNAFESSQQNKLSIFHNIVNGQYFKQYSVTSKRYPIRGLNKNQIKENNF
jgi:hypothetical protein